MSDHRTSNRPTLGEVLDLAFQAERPFLEPVYGPHQPSQLSLAVGRVGRAIGRYLPLKGGQATGLSHEGAGGPSQPENRQLSFGEVMTLRL